MSIQYPAPGFEPTTFGMRDQGSRPLQNIFAQIFFDKCDKISASNFKQFYINKLAPNKFIKMVLIWIKVKQKRFVALVLGCNQGDQIWQNSATLAKSSFGVYLVFSKILNIPWQFFTLLGKFSRLQMAKNNLAIWSRWLSHNLHVNVCPSIAFIMYTVTLSLSLSLSLSMFLTLQIRLFHYWWRRHAATVAALEPIS